MSSFLQKAGEQLVPSLTLASFSPVDLPAGEKVSYEAAQLYIWRKALRSDGQKVVFNQLPTNFGSGQ